VSSNVPNSLLGLPVHMDRSEAGLLLLRLEVIWQTSFGVALGDLDDDLRACKRWFDPVAQGQRLRRELSELPELPDDLIDPGDPLTFRVADRKLLVTPEGRCVADILQRAMSNNINPLIIESQADKYYRKLASLYREWGLHRLRTVVDLLAGETKPLQIAAAGVVIALLVNRNTSEDRAIVRFASGRERDLIDQAFFAPVDAFAKILAPQRSQRRSDPKLISGWMLYEARRRLDGCVVLFETKGRANGKVWIREDDEEEVIKVVTRDLARGHRMRVTPERFGEAYEALVVSLRRSLPRLAAYELVHERPKNTDRLRLRMMDSLRESLEDSLR
jgi:hypothetical protein